MLSSINRWVFYDTLQNELNEDYPRRTIAVKDDRSTGRFAIVCYDFPAGKDIRVEMNKMDMSGKLDSFEDAVLFIKNFGQEGVTGQTNEPQRAFGGNTDMAELNFSFDDTRGALLNGKKFDINKDLKNFGF